MVVRSNKGFYVGDVSHVLSDEIYQDFWGAKYKFADGLFTVNPIMHLSFIVAATACGPSEYYDDDGNKYYADAGNIGLVPLELVEKKGRLGLGQVFLTPGAASFHWFEGIFTIKLPEDILIRIDTNW